MTRRARRRDGVADQARATPCVRPGTEPSGCRGAATVGHRPDRVAHAIDHDLHVVAVRPRPPGPTGDRSSRPGTSATLTMDSVVDCVSWWSWSHIDWNRRSTALHDVVGHARPGAPSSRAASGGAARGSSGPSAVTRRSRSFGASRPATWLSERISAARSRSCGRRCAPRRRRPRLARPDPRLPIGRDAIAVCGRLGRHAGRPCSDGAFQLLVDRARRTRPCASPRPRGAPSTCALGPFLDHAAKRLGIGPDQLREPHDAGFDQALQGGANLVLVAPVQPDRLGEHLELLGDRADLASPPCRRRVSLIVMSWVTNASACSSTRWPGSPSPPRRSARTPASTSTRRAVS